MNVVIDASVAAAYLLGDATGVERRAILAGAHAPAFLDVEVTHVLRGLVRADKLPLDRALAARAELAELGVIRHPDHSLIDGAWALRDRCTTYDALYVALAQGLDGTLYTRDLRLARGVAGVVATSTEP